MGQKQTKGSRIGQSHLQSSSRSTYDSEYDTCRSFSSSSANTSSFSFDHLQRSQSDRSYYGCDHVPSLARMSPASAWMCSSDTLRGVLQTLDRMGLKHMCKVSLGISFAATNKTNGKKSFNGRYLHSVHPKCKRLTPYEEVIVSLSRSLATLACPGQIPAFGFGDSQSLNKSVFPFFRKERCCEDFDEVHRRYRFISQHVEPGNQSSIAPLIYNAINQVQKGGFQYHILVIVADCPCSYSLSESSSRNDSLSNREYPASSGSHKFETRSSSAISDRFIEDAILDGRSEEEVKKAIIEASKYPLSIIFIGVGDGESFQRVQETFTRRFSGQLFNNFGFVNYSHCTSSVENFEKRQIPFVYQILRLIAMHYSSIQDLYQDMQKLYQKKCLRGSSRTLLPSGSSVVSDLPREVLDADKSYKKKWSPLSAHINKSVGAIDKSLSANDTVSTMHSNARSVWTSEGLGMDEEYLSSPQLTSPPSAPDLHEMSLRDMCREDNSEGGMGGKNQEVVVVRRKDTNPPIFVCPITQELMSEPVIAEDGYTYERKAIAQWTSRSSRSPMTNQKMKSLNFISNYALRSAIKEWQQRHGGNH